MLATIQDIWYSQSLPFNTGVTRYYDFVISNGTIAPDGVQLPALIVNGAYPGPPITANWGDWIEVRVTNNIEGEGTALHW